MSLAQNKPSLNHQNKILPAKFDNTMVDAAIQGLSRFNHMDELRRGNVYLKLKGQAPSD